MTILEGIKGKIIISRSILIKSLVFLAIIVISILLLRPIQSAINSEIQKIRVNLIEKAEEITTFKIQYSSLRPSIFGTIDITDLNFNKNDDILLNISSLRFHFSIIELILRKNTFIHKVKIDRPSFNINIQRDKETFDYLMSMMQANTSFTEILKQISAIIPSNVDYSIRRLSFNLIDEKNIYKINDMNINLWRNNKDIFLSGRFDAQLVLAEVFENIIIFNTDVGINISSGENLENGIVDLILYNLVCSKEEEQRHGSILSHNNKNIKALFSVNPVNFTFLYNDNTITSESGSNEQNSKYFFKYNIENKGLFLDLSFNDFLLTDKVSISDFKKDAEHLLQTKINGTASYKKENDAMDYSVNIACDNLVNPESDLIMIDLYGNNKFTTINNVNVNLSAASAKAGLFRGGVQGKGNIQYNPLRPEGIININRLSVTGENYQHENITAAVDIISRNNEIQILSDNVKIAGADLNNFKVVISPTLTETAFYFTTSFANNGSVFMDAVLNNDPQELEASIMLDSVSFLDISEIVRPFVSYIRFPFNEEIIQKSLVNTVVFFSTNFKNIVFNAPNIIFDFDGKPGMLSVKATDSEFSISEGLFYLDEKEFLISANVLYSNPAELLFNVNLNYVDLSWIFNGQIYDKSTLIITDPNGLNVYVNLSDNNAVSGYLEGVDFPVYINSNTVFLNFFINTRYISRNLWDIGVDHITVRENNSPEGKEYFNIMGTANQNGAVFRDILLHDSISRLEGNADFTWSADFSSIDLISNFSGGSSGGNNVKEAYSVEGALRDKHINLFVSVTDMFLNRFFPETSPMLVSADAEIVWDSIDFFKARINVGKLNSITPNDYIRGSVEIQLDNQELLISNLVMDVAGLKTVLPELKVNRSEGMATAAASMDGIAFERMLEGNINLNISFARIDSWLEINNALNHFNGTMYIDNIVYNSEQQDPFLFSFSREHGAIFVTGGIKDMLRLEMDADGNFFAGLSAPLPIRGSIIGTYKHGIVDASCGNFYFDVASLWSLMVRMPDFNVSSGYITGAIDIRGPIWNPEFYGSARGSSFRFQVPNYISEDIKPVPFQIQAQGYEMSFGPVVLAVGAGSGTIDGWFLFENWSPVIVGLDINVPRDKPVPYDLKVFGFLAKGTTSGNFNMNFDSINSTMEMKGDLFTNNAELGMNMDEIGASPEGSEEMKLYTLLNIKVTLGSSVEFVWPTSSPMLRANPEMGTVLSISSDNRARQFSLVSDVKVRSGELYYFDRSFYIRQGSLIFRENETQFDPRFSARAEIRDRTDSGPVTISMIVENQPLLKFEPRFEASPALSQLEIYSILGQNVNSIQGSDDPDAMQRFLITSTTDILTQVVATSDILSEFAFMRQFERRIRDFLRLDMFSIRTRLLQNAVVFGTSGIWQTSDDFIRSSSRVGNYFDNTSVFIGKYIGQNMFVQGMATLRYDEYSDVFGGLKFELDIGIELQSPFVSIRWDIFPAHPENLWVNDNSITLSWSKSF